MAHINELEKELEAILIHQTTSYWVERLDAAGVPGGPVYTYDQTLSDPHVLAREMVVELEHPKIGSMKSLGIPVKFSKTPLSIRQAAPWVGQHTTETLRELGMRDEEIERLYDDGVIYDKYREN
jgi:crotonobetainyl-CoA:carnitine CoA-transferase CaiB-like acyl-CoA transferase